MRSIPVPSTSGTLVISCRTCVLQATTACASCLVTVVMAMDDAAEPAGDHQSPAEAHESEAHESEAHSAVAHAAVAPGVVGAGVPVLGFTDDELRAVKLLAAAGLVPSLRHREAA